MQLAEFFTIPDSAVFQFVADTSEYGLFHHLLGLLMGFLAF